MALPQTHIRLASSLTLIGVQQTTDTGSPIDGSSLSALSSAATAPAALLNLGNFAASFKPLGTIDSFRPYQNSNNYSRRGINSSREPFATAPGPLTSTIEIDKAVMYFQDAMQAFGFIGGNIAFQTRPLIIIEKVSTPDNQPTALDATDAATFARLALESLGNPSLIVNALIYLNCIIRESRISYDLKGSDQAVFQNIVMDVGRVTTPFSLLTEVTGLGAVEQVLASNIPIISSVTNKLV